MARHHGYRVRSITRQWPRAMSEGVPPAVVKRSMSAADAEVTGVLDHIGDFFELESWCELYYGGIPYDYDVPETHAHLVVNRPAGASVYDADFG